MLASEIRVLHSPIIDREQFIHGFPERTGGLSEYARESLNLGFRWGDSEERVYANRKLLAEHVGFDHSKLAVTKHVHGTKVWRVGEALPEPPEFDGLVSDEPGVVLGAFAADCVPMLFADPVARVCAAAHAGWRGTVAGVGVRVVERMIELGATSAGIRVALGPSIGPCCFEVGPEVVAAFIDAMGNVPGLVVKGPKKDHIDLRVAHRYLLEGVGLAPEHLDSNPPCTMCNPGRFFSYRRDGQEAGVHMGFIGLR